MMLFFTVIVVSLILIVTKYQTDGLLMVDDDEDNNVIKIIHRFLREKSTNRAIVYGCFFNKSHQKDFAKKLMMMTTTSSNNNTRINAKVSSVVFNLGHHHSSNTNISSIINSSNIMIQALKLLQTKHIISVIVDGDCPHMFKFLKKCGSYKFFDVKHHWLIVVSSNNNHHHYNGGDSSIDFVARQMANVTLNINADVQIANRVKKKKATNDDDFLWIWQITDIYNPGANHGGRISYSMLGDFNERRQFNFQMGGGTSKYWTRRNMTGVTFRTMIVLPAEYEGSLENYLANDENRQINTFNRFHCRLIHFCRDYYNFSLSISEDKSWGYTKSDGRFDGLSGALENRTIDFGCSPLFFKDERERVLDYGCNTWIFESGFVFRNPKSRTSFDVFIKPLSASIWFAFLVFACLSIGILKLVTIYETRETLQKMTSDDDDVVDNSWSWSIIFTIGAICQQGSPITPKLYCGRILTISVFLLFLIMYQFYSASIVSHLLLKPSTLIRTIKDLLQSPLKVGCEDTLYNKDYFLHTTDVTAQRLYRMKILMHKNNQSNFLEPQHGLELVARGNYAFHVELANAYPIIEATFSDKAICELREVQMLRTQPMYTNLQKHSPFRDMLNICLHRIRAYGMLYRERKYWRPRKPECVQSSRSVTVTVGLDEFYPALLLLVAGLVVSVLILVGERQWYYACTDNNNVIWPFVD